MATALQIAKSLTLPTLATIRSGFAPAPSGPSLRVLTCNTHNKALDANALAALIAQTSRAEICCGAVAGRWLKRGVTGRDD